MTYKLTQEQTKEVKHLVEEADQISTEMDSLHAAYEEQERVAATPLRVAQRALFAARNKLSQFVESIRLSHKNDIGTDPMEADAEDLKLYAKYIDDLVEPVREIRNKTGMIEVRPWQNDGVWIVLDDNHDCCSIGLTHDEIDHLFEIISEMRTNKVIF